MSVDLRQTMPTDGFRILDAKGCVTLEVLCFTDQLNPAQRAAVDRHTKTCSICAQQQTALARAGERFRRQHPRQRLSSEVRLTARQAALRAVRIKKKRVETTARLPAARVRRSTAQLWYRSSIFWTALLVGVAAGLFAWLLAARFL